MRRHEPVSTLLHGWCCWQPSLRSLAPRLPRALPAPAGDPEPVRRAMQAEAADLPQAAKPRLAAAIANRRRDVAGLWHLRVALMQALAMAHGEAAARRRMARRCSVFLSAWPARR